MAWHAVDRLDPFGPRPAGQRLDVRRRCADLGRARSGRFHRLAGGEERLADARRSRALHAGHLVCRHQLGSVVDQFARWLQPHRGRAGAQVVCVRARYRDQLHLPGHQGQEPGNVVGGVVQLRGGCGIRSQRPGLRHLERPGEERDQVRSELRPRLLQGLQDRAGTVRGKPFGPPLQLHFPRSGHAVERVRHDRIGQSLPALCADGRERSAGVVFECHDRTAVRYLYQFHRAGQISRHDRAA